MTAAVRDWGVFRIHVGDCVERLREMPDASVNCCVTSPPYFGLRDYGHEGQIGLEETPDAYVDRLVGVFREVRRVLRDDGTLWLNLGDSYAGGGYSNHDVNGPGWKAEMNGDKRRTRQADQRRALAPLGIKPKDLIGIPWRVAFALQQPYYAGRIHDVMDRIWLAAMIDAEGCFFIHKRKAGTASGAKFTRADGSEVAYDRANDTFSPGVEVCNTHPTIVQRCMEIAGVGSMSVQQEGRKQTLYRWTARGEEARMVSREVYPHLVGKMQQARIVAGCPTSGDKAAAGHEALKGLHHGTVTDVDFGAPESPLEPGWYLRQDVIWAKPNPMPESVRDRCTKAHEYVFLLSKSERYYFDSEAMQEPAATEVGRKPRRAKSFARKAETGAPPGQAPSHREDREDISYEGVRNKRSVWTVPTRPYSGAHFATFPPALIEPCVLAGSPPGGVVLDPFGGAGTTGLVAAQHGRIGVLCEINPEYVDIAERRIATAVFGKAAFGEAA